MLHFATYYDSNYLTRGLALLDSLQEHCTEPFKMHVIALDKGVRDHFEKHKSEHIIVISLSEIEDYFPELHTAKSNRSVIEYYFTLSPYLPLYIFERFPDINQITTMDADIYFFDDPAIILKAYPLASVLITPHHFSSEVQDLDIYGKYNVSFQSFKNNEAGRECLEDWRRNCLEWCHDYFDVVNNRFADQKYLDGWKDKFSGVEDIDIPGAGLAPWNIGKYNYKMKKSHVLVNDMPLIYYHFHHLRVFNKNFALNALEFYKVNTRLKAVRFIYRIYLKKLSSLSVNQVNLPDNIQRFNSYLNKSFIQKLNDPNGYWIFTKKNIVHVNLNRLFYKTKKIFKSVWPG